MGRIRPFVKDDIPQVADLDLRVWRGSKRPSSQALHVYYEEIFFRNPWYDEALPSLVYQENSGKISGFIGVVPRRMSMNEQPVQVVINTHGMVDPSSQFAGVGTQLVQTSYSGPQDLSISDDVNEAGCKACKKAGGTIALLYSLQWIRPLQPSRYVLSLLSKKHGLPAPIELASRPFCSVIDTIEVRMPQSRFRLFAPSTLLEEELTVEILLACLSEFSDSYALRPEYDSHSLSWLLARLSQKKRLRKVVVRKTNQEIVGWYLYYLNSGGISEVLQIGAKNDSINGVLDHLFYDAWRQGAVALAGRLDPRFIREFSDKYCLLRCNGSWTVVHSNKPEVLHAVHRGDAFFTRLEGEWPLSPPSFNLAPVTGPALL